MCRRGVALVWGGLHKKDGGGVQDEVKEGGFRFKNGGKSWPLAGHTDGSKGYGGGGDH